MTTTLSMNKTTMEENELDGVLAVPSDTPIWLTKEQGDELRNQINNKPTMTKEERELRAQRVKAMFGKPEEKTDNGKFLY